jgi:hypothetical protein
MWRNSVIVVTVLLCGVADVHVNACTSYTYQQNYDVIIVKGGSHTNDTSTERIPLLRIESDTASSMLGSTNADKSTAVQSNQINAANFLQSLLSHTTGSTRTSYAATPPSTSDANRLATHVVDDINATHTTLPSSNHRSSSVEQPMVFAGFDPSPIDTFDDVGVEEALDCKDSSGLCRYGSVLVSAPFWV